MRRLLAALLIVFSTSAFAQNPGVITQGPVTAGNCVKFVNRNMIADNGAACFGGAASFANPSVTVGLAAVNGTALTAMRSDGAPALDQTAAFAFSNLSTTTVNNAVFKVQGATVNDFVSVSTSGTIVGQSNAGGIKFQFITDNNVPDGLRFSSDKMLGANSTTTLASGVIDTFLGRAAAATWRLGAANAASPVAQTVQAQGSRAGTDSDVGGASLTINAGTGTGTGAAATTTFKAPVVVASGSGAQTQTSYLIGSGLAATFPINATLAKVTDPASAPGAANLKLLAVAGTSAGTCKIVAYAGTSTTPVTLIDNVGASC